jgi:hypothetical protein
VVRTGVHFARQLVQLIVMFGVILVLLNFLGGYKCQFTIHDDIPFTPLLKLQEMVDANLDFMIGEDIRVDYSGIYS